LTIDVQLLKSRYSLPKFEAYWIQIRMNSATRNYDELAVKAFAENFLEAYDNDELAKVRPMKLPGTNIAYFSTLSSE
jgi:hypothetical protein